MGAVRISIAIAAIVDGSVLCALLFVPYVARQYRRHSRFEVGRAVVAAAFLIYLVGLTSFVLLPLPNDLTALCARGGIRPQLQLLYVFGDIARGRTGTGPASWLRSPPLVPLLFNVTLFVPLGMFVRQRYGRSRRATIAIGFAVSLLVECTQLTGNWFLLPCAYRQFNVDDLIANTAGTALGVLLAPLLRLVDRGPSARPNRLPRQVTMGRRWLGMACDWLACTLLGAFLASVVPEVHVLATGSYLPATGVWYLGFESVLGWWLPGLLLFVVPSLVGAGGSIGQRSVLLTPTRPDGTRTSVRVRLLRVLLGSGLYALLGGVVALGVRPSDWLLVVLLGFVLASLIAVVPSREHRGLSLLLTRQVLVADPAER
jgi:glycopeptide antibiotics resistance protein